jgi:hypothetical protein
MIKENDMTRVDMMKESQWYKVKFLKDKSSGYMQGSFIKDTEGFGTVLECGSVILWSGKGLFCIFKSIEEVKEYATCIYKVDNKASAVIEAWNNVMW